jgi:hypothetical protein
MSAATFIERNSGVSARGAPRRLVWVVWPLVGSHELQEPVSGGHGGFSPSGGSSRTAPMLLGVENPYLGLARLDQVVPSSYKPVSI